MNRRWPVKILNAFSLKMLPLSRASEVTVEPITESQAISLVHTETMHGDTLESAVGHADTAKILSGIFGRDVACRRVDVRLADGETALVAQYDGPRLPEGATALPEGATFQFILVVVRPRH
jgi:hypothetical protein